MADSSRILEALIGPLGLIWCLNLVAGLLFAIKKKWIAAVLSGLVTLVLFVFGSTSFPWRLLASIERPYTNRKVESIPKCDAVIMLGGVLSPSSNDVLGFQAGDALDRTITAVELMRQAKAPVLLLGGGGNIRTGWSESRILTNWFAAWHLLSVEARLIPVCANTREEALHIQEIFQKSRWQRVILVTSAYHLQRAEAIFRKLNIPVEPVGCDFVGTSYLERRPGFNPIPTPDGFGAASLFLHEQIGWWVYRWRGWIAP